MSVLIPIKIVEVPSFESFCIEFKIKTRLKSGKNGCDEELIYKELNKITDESWIINFINDNRDGYFRLQQFEK